MFYPSMFAMCRPVFLPDPKDGSLYLLAGGAGTGHTTTLKKLPFTIQQLVASSPCRSSDGMFYTGTYYASSPSPREP